VTALLLMLGYAALRPLAAIAVVVAAAGLGMWLALMLFDHWGREAERHVDRLVTEAEAGPSNVIYLTPQLEAEHRERRLLRLLERG
jgi:hypothetical protein